MIRRYRISLITAIAILKLILPMHPAVAALHDAAETAIIVDTDMGLDDVRALFALLAADVDIHAVVTVVGSAAAGRGTDNLVGLLESIPRTDILVCRGVIGPLHEPPPWRHTANTLGGGAFPPPRRLASCAVMPAGLAGSIGEGNERFHYLALGPLCNIASLIREYPESLSAIETVWIPARIDAKRVVTGWNLLWDPKATASVLRTAPAVVIVDLSDAGSIDAHAILAETADSPRGEAGRAPAARWIARTLAAGDAQRAHCFIHDELAAAALIEPELISISNETYRASFAADGGITLDTDGGGNIRIARIRDLTRAVDLLKSLWRTPARAGHVHGADDHEIPTELLLRTFHGHLGPYVVLGYRMGMLALKRTASTGHFGISAEVHSILEPPPSCLIDGVQLGSGCTLGKRNITVRETDGPAYALFMSTGGITIRIALRAAVPALVTRLVDERGVEAAGREMLEMDPKKLFEIEIVKPAAK
jgi:inosine-uridine nucleoside N-ribohydrolase/formylmethanofuran dehydrogenase subunit E